jgi:outer membrane protein assembly factor BamB
MTKKYLTIIALTLLLTACNDTTKKLLGMKEPPKLPGQRISMLKLENDLSPDKRVEAQQVTLPSPQENPNWPNSNDTQHGLPENIALNAIPSGFSKTQIFHHNYYLLNSIFSSNSEIEKDLYYYGTPIIIGNIVYVQSSMGDLKSYTLGNKPLKLWSKNLIVGNSRQQYIGGGMTSQDGKIFVTLGNYDIVAIEAKTGQELWRRTVSSLTRSAPTLSRNLLLIKTADNKLYALNSQNGATMWVHEGATEAISYLSFASPAVADDIAVIPYSSGFLYGLHLGSNREIWAHNLFFDQLNPVNFTITDINITPVTQDRTVYSASSNGEFFAHDLPTGNVLWHKNLGGTQNFWVAGDFIFIINNSNELMTIYNKTGAVKWLTDLNKIKAIKKDADLTNEKFAGPIIAGSEIIIASSKGRLLFISPKDGLLLRQIAIPENVTLPPIAAGGKIYLYSNSGDLITIN